MFGQSRSSQHLGMIAAMGAGAWGGPRFLGTARLCPGFVEPPHVANKAKKKKRKAQKAARRKNRK